MVHVKQKPRNIDFQKSSLWAINSVNSVGLGIGTGPVGAAVGASSFDLVNRETGRAHRLLVYALGAGASAAHPNHPSLTVSFYSWSDYAYFKTKKPVNFKDFDGIPVVIDDATVGIYDWTTVTFPFSDKINISGFSASVPGTSSNGGPSEIYYSDGEPLGDVTFETHITVPSNPHALHSSKIQMPDKTVYRLPNDLLFDFDKYTLQPFQRTKDALNLVGLDLGNTGPEFNFLVVGHTDSKGPAGYNKQLSKHRAETVSKWFVDNNYVKADRMKTDGRGFDEPLESNDTASGREANRRVEVWGVRVDLWKTWKPG